MIDATDKKIIRVLVVDDSSTIRDLICHILSTDPEIDVIGTAADGEHAIELVKNKQPDVVTMDFHMPKMNGLEATRKILETTAVPIIIVSTTMVNGESVKVLHALEAGAVAVVGTPVGMQYPNFREIARELIITVKTMSEIKVVRRRLTHTKNPSRPHLRMMEKLPALKEHIELVAIGASTGGPVALKTILANLPHPFSAAILIVQHITQGFTQGLVEWLAQASGFTVQIAQSGEKLLPDHAYIAPDGFHMQLASNNTLVLIDKPPVNGHKPSVSMLFKSVSEKMGPNAIGVLLTGMGRDGAEELKLMKDKGSLTIVQDKTSCVVFGMPGEAIALGAATLTLPLEKISTTLSRIVEKKDDS